jgi:gluconate 2-dehydrogenase gamma chain
VSKYALTRRYFLGSTTLTFLFGGASGAGAKTITGQQPWTAFAANPPTPELGNGLLFFIPSEFNTVDAIVARLIPADDLGPGAKEAGCATFIDRQLAGSFGTFQRFYMQAPFANGTPQQGPQSANVPHIIYRTGLAALDAYCRATYAGKAFIALEAAQQDAVLQAMEKGEAKFEGVVPSREFFAMLLQNTREGFFADPLYGGNRDMIGWKLIGFPGARYDYRDHVTKHNQPYPLPPVGIFGRPDWQMKG